MAALRPDAVSGDLILGAGVTGLAMGLASGLTVYEAADYPGGICSSYYMAPGDATKAPVAPATGEAYRFEKGGGHWIFGGDPFVLRFVGNLVSLKAYERESAVYFHDRQLRVPYPLQNHLRYLGAGMAAAALREMHELVDARRAEGMADWLRASFGPTLGRLFFEPFHELYTAGLWREIQPQDGYKSPVNLSLAVQGALDDVPAAGYNATFLYPVEGLNTLAQRLAARCSVRYGQRVVGIDSRSKTVCFENGSEVRYRSLFSTLPLNRMMELTALSMDEKPDPSVSVLVINIGARKGSRCPKDHWVYVPTSRSGFHRVGFYSNVDPSFLPRSARTPEDRVAVYVEKAYRDRQRPTVEEMCQVGRDVTRELQEWEWIGDVEVADHTWVDVAYTWSWRGSSWKARALQALEEREIYQVGRFARWVFQGIADSIRDGLLAGAASAGSA